MLNIFGLIETKHQTKYCKIAGNANETLILWKERMDSLQNNSLTPLLINKLNENCMQILLSSNSLYLKTKI